MLLTMQKKRDERIQKLNNKVNTLEKSNNELAGVGGMWMSARDRLEISEQQNKRYREALLGIRKEAEICKTLDCDMATDFIIENIDKALEESE